MCDNGTAYTGHPMSYLWLFIAIVAEVVGTSALQASQQFSKIGASILSLVSYIITLYFFSLALKDISVGIAYAIWSGLGIVFIATIGWIWFKQALDVPAMIGLALIIAGVLVINLFSHSVVH